MVKKAVVIAAVALTAMSSMALNVVISNVVTSHQSYDASQQYTGRLGELVTFTNEYGALGLTVFDGAGNSTSFTDGKSPNRYHYVKHPGGYDEASRLEAGSNLVAVVQQAQVRTPDSVYGDNVVYIESGMYTLTAPLVITNQIKIIAFEGKKMLTKFPGSSHWADEIGQLSTGINQLNPGTTNLIEIGYMQSTMTRITFENIVFFDGNIFKEEDRGSLMFINCGFQASVGHIYSSDGEDESFLFQNCMIDCPVNTNQSGLITSFFVDSTIGENATNTHIGNVYDMKVKGGSSILAEGLVQCVPTMFTTVLREDLTINGVGCFRGDSTLMMQSAVFKNCHFTDNDDGWFDDLTGNHDKYVFINCTGIPSSVTVHAVKLHGCADETGAMIADQ